jgi:hypothetical protein
MKGKTLLTVAEVVCELRMSPRNVRALIRSGQIRSYEFCGEPLVEATDLVTYLRDNTLYPDQGWH